MTGCGTPGYDLNAPDRMAYYYSPFRSTYAPQDTAGCAFCDTERMAAQGIRSGSTYIENDSYRWIVNAFPKFEGHTLLVPKRHVTQLGTETPEEARDRESLLAEAAAVLGCAFPSHGIEVFLQTGTGSASSIAHLHWHVLPASPEDPLRSFEKLGHFYTITPGEERIVVFPLEMQRSPDQLLTFLSHTASER